jgi:aryl-alcohol dehydrogenase-like predicted oxidoreductase
MRATSGAPYAHAATPVTRGVPTQRGWRHEGAAPAGRQASEPAASIVFSVHPQEDHMISRREFLGITAGASATLSLSPRLLHALRALQQGQLIQRAIPSTGEMVPAVGLGSAATFSAVARQEDVTALREVMKALVDRGGKIFDTAPGYGASEQVAGNIAAELGIANKIFWATKVNVAGGGGRGGGSSADPAAARAQIEASFTKFKVAKIDLIQVHNLGDVPTQLAVLKALKQQGRIRYIGVTTTSDNQYTQLEQIMRNEPLDFIGLDYAADNRNVEATILPLAIQRKIGVLAYLPFGRTRLFQRTTGKALPDWAKDFDATTWAQFFIKYVIGHPAITAVTPGSSQASHMIDNMGGGVGRLPNEATRKRMAEYIDALPA